MEEGLLVIAVLIIIAFIFLLILFTYFIPVGLWIKAIFSGVKVRIFKDLVGMRLRNVPPQAIVQSKITASKAGVEVDIGKMEAHHLAGGSVQKVVNALISADRANIPLTFERATAIDLAGRDVLEAVKVSVNPKVINSPMVAAVAKDGIQVAKWKPITLREGVSKKW